VTSLGLYRFSLLVVFATLLLILAGGLVTSHDAGLAVPDWPTSYGQWFPPMVGNVFWEHGHRMIAGTVGLLTLILAFWVQVKETRKGLKIFGWILVGMVLMQALLGGLTVLYLLPPAVSIAHACLAQTFFCAVVAMAYFLQQNPVRTLAGQADPGLARLRRLLVMTTAFIYLQLILGAILRHGGPDFFVVAHILGAFLVLIHVLLVFLRVLRFYEKEKALLKAALSLGVSTICQVFLGMGAFIFTRMMTAGFSPSHAEVLFTASHQTLGAVVLAACFLMTLMVWR